MSVVVSKGLSALIDAEATVFLHQFPAVSLQLQEQTAATAVNLFLADSADLIIVPHPPDSTQLIMLEREAVRMQQFRFARGGAVLLRSGQSDAIPHSLVFGEGKDWLPGILEGALPAMIAGNNRIDTGTASIEAQHFAALPTYALGNDQEMADYLRAHPHTMGVVAMNAISTGSSMARDSLLAGLRVAGIQNADGSLAFPVQADLMHASYPFVCDYYIWNREANPGLPGEFAHFIGTDRGQRIILRHGLLPVFLPASEVRVRTGSPFE